MDADRDRSDDLYRVKVTLEADVFVGVKVPLLRKLTAEFEGAAANYQNSFEIED